MRRSGLVSQVSMFLCFCCRHQFNRTSTRCTAPADDIDAEAGRRSHAHTSALIEQYSPRILWDDYGVVGDTVSVQSSSI